MDVLSDIYSNKDFQTLDLTLEQNVPQTFSHIFGDGRVFQVNIRYNKCLQNWFMDIYQQDGVNLIPMALNIVLNFGLDLLSQYKYKNLGEFYVISKNPPDFDSPTYNDLNLHFLYIWRHN